MSASIKKLLEDEPSVLTDALALTYKIPSKVEEIETKGFRVEDKGSGGDCFFYVLLDQLKRIKYNERKPKTVQEARQFTCDHIQQNMKDYEDFLSGLDGDYLETTRKDRAYVDHPHVAAASRHYQ